MVDALTEAHNAVVANNDFFIVGTEDGIVEKYSLLTNKVEGILVRCTLPVRDLALSPDGQWVAVACEYVNVHEQSRAPADLQPASSRSK